ncbi:G:T/U mismatch-specific uracil/thymine DNA-glycosylase [plant metagenome]|uniref:G:T/U mismatch-specific uracil/thymine DNA-glycosylase n=1 Tax=plant metagenome TaxID=1297885 RepID=A0A484PBX3_9ZZZZ
MPTSPSTEADALVQGFPPAASGQARILILGSMPGVASLNAGQYYAHPRNAFWFIMADLLGLDAAAPYAQRVAQANARGVALWDVVHRCVRPGSLDARIARDSVEPNDFAGFYARHPGLRVIGFNGGAAATLYQRHVAARVQAPAGARLCVLPSTSPAHAALRPEAKLAAWREALADALA